MDIKWQRTTFLRWINSIKLLWSHFVPTANHDIVNRLDLIFVDSLFEQRVPGVCVCVCESHNMDKEKAKAKAKEKERKSEFVIEKFSVFYRSRVTLS